MALRKKSNRKRVVNALNDMVSSVINSVYPKQVLNAMKSQVIWPERLAQCKSQAPDPDGFPVMKFLPLQNGTFKWKNSKDNSFQLVWTLHTY